MATLLMMSFRDTPNIVEVSSLDHLEKLIITTARIRSICSAFS